MQKQVIIALGGDLSTSALSLVGRTANGEETFVQIPMEGAVTWCGQPAFDLSKLPGLFTEAFQKIQNRGFLFGEKGCFSLSVRQHDMVLLDQDHIPLIPSLSWQCNIAEDEAAMLRQKGAEQIVGKIHPRFLIAKLLWALHQQPLFNEQISYVMTTGDYIAWLLTGEFRLCSSEALSNGLLRQQERTLAVEVISKANLDREWFPGIAKSGEIVGIVSGSNHANTEWNAIRETLKGWRVFAGLGDNHAGAVGSGLSDFHTVVISAGTSGTATRICKPGISILGEAASFEFYSDRLLLRMLADCTDSYNKFATKFGEGRSHAELSQLAFQEARASYFIKPEDALKKEPGWFRKLSLGEKIAALQNSIACLLRGEFTELQKEVDEVTNTEHTITRVVLTGGITRSPWFLESMRNNLRNIARFYGKVFVSNRTGDLASQAATLGALINAMVGGGLYENRAAAAKELCPLRSLD